MASPAASPLYRLSMRDAMRQRLLDYVIRLVQKAGKSSQKAVMVLDARSTRVVSAAMQLFDLSEEGIALVEPLEKLRQPFPVLPAIYLVEPTEANVTRIVQDFADRKRPTYAEAHVFFTRKAPDAVIAAIRVLAEPPPNRKKHFVPRLANLFEANVDFLAVEEHAFHLDLPRALLELFGPDDARADHCSQRIVDGMASLCATLHEYPWIRFVQGSDLGEKLARGLQSRQDALFRDDKDFWFHGSDDKSGGGMARATVLFLDRRQDLAAPLLHEFTYQALVYDLLESRDQLVAYGEKPEERANLGEQDLVWTTSRHLHLSTVIERLTAQVREFQNTSAGRFKEEGSQMSLEEMAGVVKDIPLYNEVMAGHAKHLALCQACMDRVRKRDLFGIAAVEQTLVTGTEPDGTPASETKVMAELASLMRRTELDPRDKLRLACLHAVTLATVKQDVVMRFMRDANLDPAQQQALLGLVKLGLRIEAGNAAASSVTSSQTVSQWVRAASQRFNSSSEQQPERISPYREPSFLAKQQAVAKATTIKVSRFQPLMQAAAEALVASQLSAETFPFVMQPPPGSGFGGMPFEDLMPGARVVRKVTTANRALSVRTHTAVKRVSDSKSIENAMQALRQEEQVGHTGARLIVFIAGGMTYSEMRAITDLAATCKREVIVGSTHVLRPDDFVRHLALLGDDEQARQFLESDENVVAEALQFFKDKPEEELPLPEPEPLSEDLRFEMDVNERLNWTTWIFTKIPGGKRIARWLDGEDEEDDDEEDDDERPWLEKLGCTTRKPVVERPAAAAGGGEVVV